MALNKAPDRLKRPTTSYAKIEAPAEAGQESRGSAGMSSDRLAAPQPWGLPMSDRLAGANAIEDGPNDKRPGESSRGRDQA